jgi:membrane-associated protein
MGIDLDPDLSTLAAASVYLIVFSFIFVESGLLVGFFLPGDTILFGAGLAAAAPNSDVHLGALVVGALIAAIAGDAVGYFSGRRLGRPWLLRRAGKRGINASTVARAERFYDDYGWFAVVAARWIPWVRTFTPIVAGVARMPYPRFLSANVVGALAWAAGLIVLGYLSYQLPALRYTAYVVGGFFVLMSIIGGAVAMMRRRRSRPDAPGPGVADPAGR